MKIVSNQFTLWLEQLLCILLTFLLTNGADVDACTHNQVGEYSPLKIAMDNHGENHPAILWDAYIVCHAMLCLMLSVIIFCIQYYIYS